MMNPMCKEDGHISWEDVENAICGRCGCQFDNTPEVDPLLGREVVGISGAYYPDRDGYISGEDSDRWGCFYIVTWEDGQQERFFKYQLQPVEQKRGIGVYYK